MMTDLDLAWMAWRVALHELPHAPTREDLTLDDERPLFDAWSAGHEGGSRRGTALAAWEAARAPQAETHEDHHYVLTFEAWWERITSAGLA